MRPAARLSLVVVAVISIAAVSASCSRKVGPSEVPTLLTDEFTGTINPGGISAHVFNVRYELDFTDAIIAVTSLTSVATGQPVSISVGVGFGAVSNETCTLAPSYSATRLINQTFQTIDAPFSANPYCAMILDDPDNPTIPEPLNYKIVVTHY